MRENEIYLESIVQTVRESLLVLDSDFKVISSNDHFLRTFKVSNSETVGKILYKIVYNMRKDNELSKIPVIIISASRDGKEVVIGAGADDFISKPFDIDELIKKG